MREGCERARGVWQGRERGVREGCVRGVCKGGV